MWEGRKPNEEEILRTGGARRGPRTSEYLFTYALAVRSHTPVSTPPPPPHPPPPLGGALGGTLQSPMAPRPQSSDTIYLPDTTASRTSTEHRPPDIARVEEIYCLAPRPQSKRPGSAARRPLGALAVTYLFL